MHTSTHSIERLAATLKRQSVSRALLHTQQHSQHNSAAKAHERPQDTPDGFWELSFQDSIANR